MTPIRCDDEAEALYRRMTTVKDRIFRELLAPIRAPQDRPTWSEAEREDARHLAEMDVAKRRALFLAIWPQMLWGLHPKEVIQLRVRDWNPASNELTVRGVTSTAGRHVMVDSTTASMLTRLTQGRLPEDAIYTTVSGEPWKNTLHMGRHFTALLRRVGVHERLSFCRLYAARTLKKLVPSYWPSDTTMSELSSIEALTRVVLDQGGRWSPATRAQAHLYEEYLKYLAKREIHRTSGFSVAAPASSPARAPSAHGVSKDSDEHTTSTMEDA